MGEETLIIRAKRGNLKAKEQLILNYEPMIHSLIKEFYFPKSDFQDMVQEGKMGVLTALQEYSPDSKYPFSSLVYLEVQKNLFAFVMQNSIISTRYQKKKIVVNLVGEIFEIRNQPATDDVLVYEEVIQQLIDELFGLDDFKRFLVSRKYGLFGHFPLTIQQLTKEANTKFKCEYREEQIKNRLTHAIRILRLGMKAKGIEGEDIWKIKNKKSQQKKGRKGRNFLKVMSGGMVAKVASITRSSWKVVFSYR